MKKARRERERTEALSHREGRSVVLSEHNLGTRWEALT